MQEGRDRALEMHSGFALLAPEEASQLGHVTGVRADPYMEGTALSLSSFASGSMD